MPVNEFCVGFAYLSAGGREGMLSVIRIAYLFHGSLSVSDWI